MIKEQPKGRNERCETYQLGIILTLLFQGSILVFRKGKGGEMKGQRERKRRYVTRDSAL